MPLIDIRAYRPTDSEGTFRLFQETVREVNKQDYTPKQLAVWAGDEREIDPVEWNERLMGHVTLVAVLDNQILGFADMDQEGYLDRLYTHKEYQRKGIGHALVSELEKQVVKARYTTHASITARPFFEKQGYQMVKRNVVVLSEVSFTNYFMSKEMT